MARLDQTPANQAEGLATPPSAAAPVALPVAGFINAGVRHDWTREEAQAIYDAPFNTCCSPPRASTAVTSIPTRLSWPACSASRPAAARRIAVIAASPPTMSRA